MSSAHAASFQLTLLISTLGATCLTGVLLALECFASKPWARRAPGVLVALLATLAVAALCFQQTFWIATGCGGLAVLLLLAWPIHFEGARAQIGRLARPKVVWAALLGVSLVAARYLAAGVLSSFDLPAPEREVDLADVPVRATEALTDKGRAISLFHFKMYSTAAEVERFIETNEKDRAQLIRLLEANPASNCHGWVFTSGRYGIRDTDVAAILNDNDYIEVTEPHEGDLAVYTTHDQICHSGLVRIANKHAPVLIESKWGPFGVYLHAVKAQPFAAQCKFYRSARATHVLALRPSHSPTETVSLALPFPRLEQR